MILIPGGLQDMILKHRSLCIFLVFAFLGALLAGAGITVKAKGIPSLWDGTVDALSLIHI